jgi:excisionase family DNA binding protein
VALRRRAEMRTPPKVVEMLHTLAEGGLLRQRKLITPRECHRDRFQGKISLRKVYDLFHDGELEGFRVGKAVLLYDDSVEAYIARNRNIKPPAEDQESEKPPVRGPVNRKQKPHHPQQPGYHFFHLPEGR